MFRDKTVILCQTTVNATHSYKPCWIVSDNWRLFGVYKQFSNLYRHHDCGYHCEAFRRRSMGSYAYKIYDAVVWHKFTFILTTKSVAMLSGIVARLTATTAILSPMCRQVWGGTFGICLSHARTPIPMQTNALDTSRCADRYMQTGAPID